MGPSLCLLVPSWGHLGASWPLLGAILGPFSGHHPQTLRPWTQARRNVRSVLNPPPPKGCRACEISNQILSNSDIFEFFEEETGPRHSADPPIVCHRLPPSATVPAKLFQKSLTKYDMRPTSSDQSLVKYDMHANFSEDIREDPQDSFQNGRNPVKMPSSTPPDGIQ